jgi:hypothetical protein
MSLQNWFTERMRSSFEVHAEALLGAPGLRVLQLGAFAGDLSCWLLDQVVTGPGATLVDVDTWGGSTNADEAGLDWPQIAARYQLRTEAARAEGRCSTFRGTTAAFFTSLKPDETFDLIVVDADHHAASVLEDAIAAFHHLRDGGLLVLEHYTWSSPEGLFASPRIGIDAFCAVYANQVEVLERGQAIWLKKRPQCDLRLLRGGGHASVG